MKFILALLVSIILGGITSYFAQKKGRDPTIWFIIGVLLGVLGLLLLFILPSPSNEEETEEAPNALPSPLLPADYLHREWFYINSERAQIGPISFDMLKNNWNQGTLKIDTLVWCEGMHEWHPLSNLNLFA